MMKMEGVVEAEEPLKAPNFWRRKVGNSVQCKRAYTMLALVKLLLQVKVAEEATPKKAEDGFDPGKGKEAAVDSCECYGPPDEN